MLLYQEQEARTELLRDRSKKRIHSEIESGSVPQTNSSLPASGSSDITDIYQATGHINFFKEAEAGVSSQYFYVLTHFVLMDFPMDVDRTYMEFRALDHPNFGAKIQPHSQCQKGGFSPISDQKIPI